jgi:hypothetical protein
MTFYVYVWLREDATPYYVGKTNRVIRTHSQKHSVNPPRDRSRIVVYPMVDEEDAFNYEKELIAWFGRKDLGTGCLRNLTDGGEGTSNPSLETRTKMSTALFGNQRFLGHKHTPETLEKMSAAKRGISPTLETRAKMSAAKRGRRLSIEHKAKLSVAKLGNQNARRMP